jgi:sec-independent protein translocase protein TatA
MIETLAFLQNLHMGEILIIVLVVVLLFGAQKIPQLMRSMGSGINQFKKGLKEGEKEAEEEAKAEKKEEAKPSEPEKK